MQACHSRKDTHLPARANPDPGYLRASPGRLLPLGVLSLFQADLIQFCEQLVRHVLFILLSAKNELNTLRWCVWKISHGERSAPSLSLEQK